MGWVERILGIALFVMGAATFAKLLILIPADWQGAVDFLSNIPLYVAAYFPVAPENVATVGGLVAAAFLFIGIWLMQSPVDEPKRKRLK